MPTYTLADLTTRVRARVGLPYSTEPTDVEIGAMLNASLGLYYDKLVLEFGHEYFATSIAYVSSADVACAAGTTTPLDVSTYLKVLDVIMTINGVQVHLDPFNLADRDRFLVTSVTPWRRGGIRYRLFGSQMQFEPTGKSAGYVGTIYYIPIFVPLVAPATVQGFNGWEELAVVDAARKVRERMRQDTSGFDAELAAMIQRVDVAAHHRNASASQRYVRRSGW